MRASSCNLCFCDVHPCGFAICTNYTHAWAFHEAACADALKPQHDLNFWHLFWYLTLEPSAVTMEGFWHIRFAPFCSSGRFQDCPPPLICSLVAPPWWLGDLPSALFWWHDCTNEENGQFVLCGHQCMLTPQFNCTELMCMFCRPAGWLMNGFIACLC